MKILLAAEESAGMQMLRALGKSQHQIIAVLTSPPGGAAAGGALWKTAEKMKIPAWPARLVKDSSFAQRVKDEEVDILLNVHSLYIIRKEVLEAPRIGAFNIHPGPLPRYAGLNAPSWAIFNGETTHGVTIHKMVPGIDEGPIIYQKLFEIGPADSALTVALRCIQEGVPLLLRLLEVASKNPDDLPEVSQDFDNRTYFGREIPLEGKINWELPAEKIFNFVRACDYFPFPSPWGHPTARLDGREIAIIKTELTGKKCSGKPGTVVKWENSSLAVACGDCWLLVDKILADGKVVKAETFLSPGMVMENG